MDQLTFVIDAVKVIHCYKEVTRIKFIELSEKIYTRMLQRFVELSPEEKLIAEYKKGKKIRDIVSEMSPYISYSEAVVIIRSYLSFLYISGHDISTLAKMTSHSKSAISLHLKKSGVLNKYSRWGKIPRTRVRMTSIPRKFFKFTPRGARWYREGEKVYVEFHSEIKKGDYHVYSRGRSIYLYIPPIIPRTARERRWHLISSHSTEAVLEFEYREEKEEKDQ